MASQDLLSESSDTIVILPNNISIRRYRVSDVHSMSHHANNKNVWNNLRNRLPHPYTISDAEIWMKYNQDQSNWVASGPYTPSPGGAPGGTASGELMPTNYVICIEGEAIGSIGLDFGAPNEIYARTAEVGYWLSEDHWGKGVMGVVVPAFVEWTWRTFGRLVRLNATPFGRNVGSRRCLEKAGFAVEGVRRMNCVKNGVIEDEVIMGMLRPGIVVSEGA